MGRVCKSTRLNSVFPAPRPPTHLTEGFRKTPGMSCAHLHRLQWVQKKSCPLGLSEGEKGIKLTTQRRWNGACSEHLGLLPCTSQTMNYCTFKCWSNSARKVWTRLRKTIFQAASPLLTVSEHSPWTYGPRLLFTGFSNSTEKKQVLWLKCIFMSQMCILWRSPEWLCHDCSNKTCVFVFPSFTLVPLSCLFILCSLTMVNTCSIYIHIDWLCIHWHKTT